jgi:hypothetical protein
VNKISLKNVFSVILQLPLSLVLYLCGLAEKHFTYWMLALENPLSHPMTELAAKKIKSEQGAACIERDKILTTARKIIRRDNYRAFKAWLLLHNDDFIGRFRVALEVEFFDLVTNARHQDPHLYAVLKPTRHENLRRVDKVFCALTSTMQSAIIAAALTDKQHKA